MTQLVSASAGVAHELRGPLWKVADQLDQFGRAESSCQLESGEMIGGAAIAIGEDAMKSAAEKWDLEGAPHPGDVEFLRDASHRFQHRRRQMGVLMGIEVSWRNAGIQDFTHLRRQLVVDSDLAGDNRCEQT